MHKTTIMVIAAAALALGGCGGGGGSGSNEPVVMTRDAASGAAYGSAGPRTCPNRKVPADGAPSPEQAAAYSICNLEGESSQMLYLIDKIVVTGIGKPRAYNRNEDVNYGQIDVERPIYDIRGSYDRYQCRMISTSTVVDMGPKYQKGANCNLYGNPNAVGACYVDTFGDWRCSMVDTDSKMVRDDAPAPG